MRDKLRCAGGCRVTDPVCPTEVEDAILHARSVLIATDCDVEAGCACPRSAAALQKLAASPKITVALLSAKRVADMRRHVPVENAIFAGNGGLEISGGPFHFVHPEAERLSVHLARVCEEVQEAITNWPGAWVENRWLTANVHVRNCSVDDWLPIRDAIRSVVRPVDDVFTLWSGRAAFEILPRIGWDKGSALKYIARELALEETLTICIGGDESDVSMFSALPDSIPIRGSMLPELLEWIADVVHTTPQRTTFPRSPLGLSRIGSKGLC